MDFLTQVERSKRMSLIRGTWTKQEKVLHNYLKGRKVKHKMHPALPGTPDFIVGKTAVFLNGCFWHKCPRCYKEPQSRKDYWVPKIQKNVERDARKRRELRKLGYRTLVIWEHETQKRYLDKVLEKICRRAQQNI